MFRFNQYKWQNAQFGIFCQSYTVTNKAVLGKVENLLTWKGYSFLVHASWCIRRLRAVFAKRSELIRQRQDSLYQDILAPTALRHGWGCGNASRLLAPIHRLENVNVVKLLDLLLIEVSLRWLCSTLPANYSRYSSSLALQHRSWIEWVGCTLRRHCICSFGRRWGARVVALEEPECSVLSDMEVSRDG